MAAEVEEPLYQQGLLLKRQGRNPEALVNLSEIDFEALQAKFAQGHKRTEAEKLRQLPADVVKAVGAKVE